MSNDTAAPEKLSFLTRAALKAQAKMTSTPTDEEGATTESKINYKKIAIGAGAVVAAGGAVFAAIKLFTGQSPVEEENSEDHEFADN